MILACKKLVEKNWRWALKDLQGCNCSTQDCTLAVYVCTNQGFFHRDFEPTEYTTTDSPVPTAVDMDMAVFWDVTSRIRCLIIKLHDVISQKTAVLYIQLNHVYLNGVRSSLVR